jgi:hypothetical protein
VTIKREQNVIELQIAIYDPIFVEVFQCQTYFGSIELRTFGTELTSLDVQHEIATADILHDKVNSCLCLETSMQVK